MTGYDTVLLHTASHGHPYPERARRHSVAGLLLMGSIDPRDFRDVPPSLPCVGLDRRLEGANRASVLFDGRDPALRPASVRARAPPPRLRRRP